jgi:hypothetical protein
VSPAQGAYKSRRPNNWALEAATSRRHQRRAEARGALAVTSQCIRSPGSGLDQASPRRSNSRSAAALVGMRCRNWKSSTAARSSSDRRTSSRSVRCWRSVITMKNAVVEGELHHATLSLPARRVGRKEMKGSAEGQKGDLARGPSVTSANLGAPITTPCVVRNIPSVCSPPDIR